MVILQYGLAPKVKGHVSGGSVAANQLRRFLGFVHQLSGQAPNVRLFYPVDALDESLCPQIARHYTDHLAADVLLAPPEVAVAAVGNDSEAGTVPGEQLDAVHEGVGPSMSDAKLYCQTLGETNTFLVHVAGSGNIARGEQHLGYVVVGDVAGELGEGFLGGEDQCVIHSFSVFG